MNQLQLPVDVHFVVEDDGRTSLLVGGMAMPFDPRRLSEILSSPSLRQKARKPKPTSDAEKGKPKLRVVKGGKSNVQRKTPEWIANIAKANRKRNEERAKKGLCLRCDAKPEPGRMVCQACTAKNVKSAAATRRRKAAA